jgi:hypothetical protein
MRQTYPSPWLAWLLYSAAVAWGCGDTAKDGPTPEPAGMGGEVGDGGQPTTAAGKASGGALASAGQPEDPSPGGSTATTEGGAAGRGEDVGGAPGEAGAPSSDPQAGAPGSAGAGGDGGALDCLDQDRDGYGVGAGCQQVDCDDQNPLVSPSMVELADDGRDNDCAGGDLHAKNGVGYYVDGSDPACSDAAVPRGTQDVPYCTLLMAVIEAYQNTSATDPVGRNIFVAQGTYPASIGFPRAMRLYGGYDSSDWSYDPVSNETVIGGADDMGIYSSWLTPTVDANAVVQGFSIKGGKKPGAPIFAVDIYSSGHVVLAYNSISAGSGYQTLGVNIRPSAENVWLIGNRISAGVPETSSNYGVNNLGVARLWGNVIDAGQGQAGSWAAAVQNYGFMYLTGNVLNGGDYGGGANDSYGFINLQTGDPPSAGTANAVGNVIYGGRGQNSSIGVLSNSPLVLINNVIGDRTPGSLPWSSRPNASAEVLNVGFASETRLLNNALVQLVYSDEVSPPNPDARRHLLTHSSTETSYVETIAVVNQCDFTGCMESSGNVTGSPGFVGAPDFHLAPGSTLLGAGTDPLDAIPGGLALLDPDVDLRPLGLGWDIGVDERE